MYVNPRYKSVYKSPKTNPKITSIGKCTPSINLENAIIISNRMNTVNIVQKNWLK